MHVFVVAAVMADAARMSERHCCAVPATPPPPPVPRSLYPLLASVKLGIDPHKVRL